jgi:hypothetical protein
MAALAACCLVGVAVPALALADRSAGPREVRLQFRRVGLGSASTDGRYVVLASGYAGPDVKVTLIDGRTGTRRPLPQSDSCTALGGFGPPGSHLLEGTGCVSSSGKLTIPLYSLMTGRTRFVTINSIDCNVEGEEECSAGAGSDWAAFTLTAYHEPTQSGYQNLRTGAVTSGPTLTPTTQLDLNSPTLTSRICPPLRNVPNSSLTFYGRFAIDEVEHGHAFPEYLVRCGSKLHMRLTSPLDVFGTGPRVFGSSSALMWPAGAHLLEGIALPSLARFEIRTPSAFDDQVTSFTLSSKTLYAEDNNIDLWAARWTPPT